MPVSVDSFKNHELCGILICQKLLGFHLKFLPGDQLGQDCLKEKVLIDGHQLLQGKKVCHSCHLRAKGLEHIMCVTAEGEEVSLVREDLQCFKIRYL